MKLRDEKLRELALAVIQVETDAVSALAKQIDESFVSACSLMYHCKGRVVVIGMGKSGHIAGKIAATLASTGTPAFFVHPGEASHGDLGMITRLDVVLALSNSGETEEIIKILPIIKRLNVPLIAMTGNPKSTLAGFATTHINVGVAQEACPLGLAPTSSTTAALVMGDALAVSLLEARGFTRDDFALSHPGGTLGKTVVTCGLATSCMWDEAMPLVHQSALISAALLEMTAKKLGMTAIVDDGDRVIGIFTDGDLRRMLAKNLDVRTTCIAEVMTPELHRHQGGCTGGGSDADYGTEKNQRLIVVDDQHRALGALNMHDLIRAGIV